MDNNDGSKLEGREVHIENESRVAKAISNFWYHHRWTVIIVTFFVAVFIIILAQMLLRVDYDCKITFAGNYKLSSASQSMIANDLQGLMKEDLNGDGEKHVSIIHYSVYSESQMKAANKDKDNGVIVNSQDNTTAFNQFFQFTGSGESSIFFLSEYLYDILKKENRLLPLNEIFGEDMPMGAMSDGFGVKLCDSALYARYSSFEIFPRDTVICIAKPLVWGNSSKEDTYNSIKAYFKEILECE